MAMRGRRIRIAGVIIVLSLLLPGCPGGLLQYSGWTASEERRISLREGGERAGRLRTGDVAVDYRYRVEDGMMEISGSVDLPRSVKVWRFTLMLHFADSEGVVLRGHYLVSAGYKTMWERKDFRKRLAVPPRAAFISFSYSGTTSGTGESGSPTDFWLTP